MNSENPKLINRQSGVVIEINANPFLIGRGLNCNYVLPSKVVSRVHCILEKDDKNAWVLEDTSTNGTYVNGKLIKSTKSPPLNNGAIITLDNYDFQLSMESNMDDITDEQLFNFAESVLDAVEVFQQSPQNHEDIAISSPMVVESVQNARASTSGHSGVATSAENHINKKQKTEVVPSIDAITAHTSLVDLKQNDTTSTSREKQKPGTSTDKDKPPPDVTPAGDIASEPKKTAVDQQQDNFEEMENELQCSICSELFVKAVTLNCAHTFCKYCIELWKKNKMECPICRAKITSVTATLVLDNVIEKVIEGSSDEVKQHRKQLLEERQNLDKPKPPEAQTRQNQSSRGRGASRRGRRGRGGNGQPQQTNYSASISIDLTANPVVEVSSESDSDWDNSDIDSDYTDEWRDEYDNDDWYDEGIPGVYYGGYGYCFRCGRRGHWANGCPHR